MVIAVPGSILLAVLAAGAWDILTIIIRCIMAARTIITTIWDMGRWDAAAGGNGL